VKRRTRPARGADEAAGADVADGAGAAPVAPAVARLAAVDWTAAGHALDDRGWARIPGLLAPGTCAGLARLFDDDHLFRSTVDMEPRRYGVGRYRYFAAPLPPLVAALRAAAYVPLAHIANRWQAARGAKVRFPARLPAFLRACRAAGQAKPTPLLLRYEAGGCNRLHQDIYGAVAFPLQLTVMLGRPGIDFDGGEFLLVEQRPREQSIGTALALAQGEAVIATTRDRPVPGRRGRRRVVMRHGVSLVTRGVRTTLGIIFHDAR
jgi:hypothetical protein